MINTKYYNSIEQTKGANMEDIINQLYPKLDFNVNNPDTTRYRRTHNYQIKEVEDKLTKLNCAYKTILTNSGMESLAITYDLIKPRIVITSSDSYFENREYLKYQLGIKYDLATYNDLIQSYKKVLNNSVNSSLISTKIDPEMLNLVQSNVDYQYYCESHGYFEISSFSNIDELTSVINRLIDSSVFKSALQSIGITPISSSLSSSYSPFILLSCDTLTTFASFTPLNTIHKVLSNHKVGTHSLRDFTVVLTDNTLPSLYYSKSLSTGVVDIVIESYTKYLCGYGDCFAGGISLSSSLSYLLSQSTPGICPNQDSLSWVLAHRGTLVSPLTAYFVNRGLQTLKVRLDSITSSTKQVYNYLTQAFQSNVPSFNLVYPNANIYYPGITGLITISGISDNSPDRNLSIDSISNRFLQAPNHIFHKLGTFGTTYSIVDQFRLPTRYPDVGNCIRLSIGLEPVNLIIQDIEYAFQL